MTEESWIFLIDEFYYITGKGTVLSGGTFKQYYGVGKYSNYIY